MQMIFRPEGQSVSAVRAATSMVVTGSLLMLCACAAWAQEQEASVQGSVEAVDSIAGPNQRQLNSAHESVAHWLYATHDYSGRRYVPLDQINARNVGDLQPVCAYQAGDLRAFHTNPLVYQGVMYLTTRYEALAIDARTCRERWRRSWNSERDVYAQANRGMAIKEGTLVWGTADGRLFALDATTGEIIWERQHADVEKGEKFNMPPLIFEDLAIIGVAGSESGIQGWIGAFRLSNGEPVWRFNVVPEPGEPGAETWGSAEALKHGGGGVWTPVTLESETGRVYVGTANPVPTFDGDTRPGKNLYTNSLLVLDAHSGKRVWHKQLVAHDVHDRGVTAPGPLYTTSIDGEERPLVATAGKDGVLRVIDRGRREVVFVTPVTTMLNTEVELTPEGVRVCPGLLGGVQWNGPSYHPASNMLYVPSVDWCTTYEKGEDEDDWLSPHMGGSFTFEPVRQSQGWLHAVDAATGKIRWRYQSDAPMVGAVTTTSGGLVLTGEVSGDFIALNAETGDVLYRFNTGGAVSGGIVTYRIEGKQYIGVTSGGMTPFWQRPGGSSTVFIFTRPVAP